VGGAEEARGLYERPAELLRRLLRFDTTNPPGAEGECVAWIAACLEELGCRPQLLADASGRPNLLARIPGRGQAPPLLLQGHVDVVAAGPGWSREPFAGDLEDGYVWGRGALDMKGGVAMMLAAFMRTLDRGTPPPGEVILCLMCDEEAGSDHGAHFLVREHPEQFAGVRYAIGEFGGFTMEIAGRRLYPIMVAEKQVCWARARFRGPAGHGSMPLASSAAGQLGRLLDGLRRRRLPVHVTPATRAMIEAIATELPQPLALPLRGLLVPRLTDRLLDALGERGRLFDPLLHNTATANVIGGGGKINVIPAEVTAEIDCRLLPGLGPQDVFTELRALAGAAVELEVIRHDPVAASPDMGLFETLAGVLRDQDPAARAVPMLLPGATDGRFFSRLGIQTYGFLPLQLPADLRFMELIHAPDERVPAAAIEFGAHAIATALERFD
jgi:acetylornithine deacetylase/succinyl-diaminopimelate desuccinylase-like protein